SVTHQRKDGCEFSVEKPRLLHRAEELLNSRLAQLRVALNQFLAPDALLLREVVIAHLCWGADFDPHAAHTEFPPLNRHNTRPDASKAWQSGRPHDLSSSTNAPRVSSIASS